MEVAQITRTRLLAYIEFTNVQDNQLHIMINSESFE